MPATSASAQNLDVVIDAAALLQARDRTSCCCSSATATARPALEAAVAARELDNVRFLPFQPRDQLRWTYASSDVCLVSLKPGLAGYIVPSKLYPILAAGRPYIAAVESLSEVAALTERHRCGVVVDARRCRRTGRRHRPRSPIRRAEREAMGARARIAARAVRARSAGRRACAGDRRSGRADDEAPLRHRRVAAPA